MKIAGYIADLLYEYECVVIPGLGGFITRDHPAYIHPMKHYFKPPHREVVFNPMLRTNDGLLLSHIARFEKLTYQEAKSRLDRFVLRCITVMDEGKRIKFRTIGSIFYTKDKQLVFEPEPGQNYLASSFGLGSFVSPPIKRDDFQRRVEKVFSSPPPQPEKNIQTPKKTAAAAKSIKTSGSERILASRRPSRIRKQLAIVGAAAAVLLFAWGGMNYKTVNSVYQQYKDKAALFPVFYSSPNEYIINNYEKLPVEALLPEGGLTAKTENLFKAKAGINDLIPADSYKLPLDSATIGSKNPIRQAELEIIPEAVPYDELDSEGLDKEVAVSQPAIAPQQIEAQPETIAETQKPMEMKATPQENKATKSGKTYYIIAGAFKEKLNAEKLIANLNQKNFKATFAGKTGSGLWRVSYGEFETEEQALNELAMIRQKENAQAWLLAL